MKHENICGANIRRHIHERTRFDNIWMSMQAALPLFAIARVDAKSMRQHYVSLEGSSTAWVE
jgi:hypothetical protein